MYHKTINEVIRDVNTIHKEFSSNINEMKFNNILNKLAIIKQYKESINSIADRINSIAENCFRHVDDNINDVRQEIMFQNISELLPRRELVQTHLNEPTYEIAPDVTIGSSSLITVKSASMIPNQPIYHIQDSNEFGIRINNVLLKGHVANIHNNNNNTSPPTKLIRCRFGKKCSNIQKNNDCKFYHDPLDFPDGVDNTEYRNFTNGSFMYSSDAYSDRNKSMRHLGDRSRLKEDILRLSKLPESSQLIEIDKLRAQALHDLLLIVSMQEIGLFPSLMVDLPN